MENTLPNYPYIREAIPEDYESIWAIWMQEHVSQWMSFPKQTKEEFKVLYSRLQKESTIYVFIDLIDHEEKIIAVGRIKFGKNQYRHIAEYCSLAIDKDFLKQGYIPFFYQEREQLVRNKGLQRIQLTQSGGNEAAFRLTEKNFAEEAVFPDWLKRHQHHGTYHLIERYIYRFLDPEFAKMAAQLPSLKYQEIFPATTPKMSDVIIHKTENTFICTLHHKPILSVSLQPDESVIQHVGFLSITLHNPDLLNEAIQGFRQILLMILNEGRVKKLELFTADSHVANLCKQLGFFVRGEKIASYLDEKEGYKNELCLEYSFFGIQEAKELIKAHITDNQKRQEIDNILSKCTEIITSLPQNQCDTLGKKYLENLIYQMVRDDFAPNRVFSLADKRWISLLEYMPEKLQEIVFKHRNVNDRFTL